MEFTTYLADAVLDHVNNLAALTQTPLYLGLFTADPTVLGSLVAEVTAAEYTRMAITWNTAANRETKNAASITFPTATSVWGTVTHVAIIDTSVLTTGNIYYSSVIRKNGVISPIYVDDQVVVKFDADDLLLRAS